MRNFPPILAVLTLVFLGACGSETGAPDNPDRPEGTPTPTVTPTPASPGEYNIARFAKIEASHTIYPTWEAITVVDGMVSDEEGRGVSHGFTWVPNGHSEENCTEVDQDVRGTSITLEWNSQIRASSIRLFDSARIGAQITRGEIEFKNQKDSSVIFSERPTFGALPDDASSAATVAGPGQPFTSMTVRLHGNKGTCAGISEIEVMGSRVDEAIDRSNVALFGMIPKSTNEKPTHSTPLGLLHGYGYNHGPFRVENIKDDLEGDGGDPWKSFVSVNAAGNFFVNLEFDRMYEIDEIVLYDRTSTSAIFDFPHGEVRDVSAARFTAGSIDFKDGAAPSVDFTKSSAARSVTIHLDSPVVADGLRINLSEVSGGDDTGLAEVKVFGRYVP